MGDSKRWSVTYTKHLKQKRKVYQDGALELHASCQKVLLYDDCGKLLVSRFLKKDEVIESGGTLTFDAHLVDIGELEGICKPLRDLNIQRKDEKPTEKMGIQRQKASCNSSENRRTQFPNSGTSHNRPVVMKKIVTGNKQIGLQNSGMPQKQPNAAHTSREWHALYSTQMTQKAKRYHDGTLRLSLCGSHQRQVMLYDDCGKLLATRFLKKDELVESGVELAFDTHLVDVGDLEENSKCQAVLNVEGDKQSIGKIGMVGQKVRQNSSVDNKAAKLQSSGKPSNIVKGILRNDDHSGRVAGLYSSRSIVDGFTSSGRAPRNDLLRDASKILSVLKKPVANESLHAVNLQMKQTSILQSSDLLQSGHQGNGQNAPGVESLKVDAEDKCGIRNCRENTQIGSLRSNFSQSKETQELPTLSFTNLVDPERKEKLQPDKFFLPSTSFPHMAASNTSKPQLDMEFTDKVMIDLTTPMGGSHATEVIICDSPENKLIDGKSPEVVSSTASCGVISRAPFSYSSEYKQVYESSTLTRSECDQEESNSVDDGIMLPEFSSNDVWVVKVAKGKPKQASMDNQEPDAQKCKDAFLLGSSSSLGGPPGCVVANAEGESTEDFKSVSEKMMNTDDFPSFDLGIST